MKHKLRQRTRAKRTHGGCANESSCTLCNLLGRVSHPRNSRQDKNLYLVGGGAGEALSASGAFPTPTEPAGETSPPWGMQRGHAPFETVSSPLLRVQQKFNSTKISSRESTLSQQPPRTKNPSAEGRSGILYGNCKPLRKSCALALFRKKLVVTTEATSQVSRCSTCSAEFRFCETRGKIKTYAS